MNKTRAENTDTREIVRVVPIPRQSRGTSCRSDRTEHGIGLSLSRPLPLLLSQLANINHRYTCKHSTLHCIDAMLTSTRHCVSFRQMRRSLSKAVRYARHRLVCSASYQDLEFGSAHRTCSPHAHATTTVRVLLITRWGEAANSDLNALLQLWLWLIIFVHHYQIDSVP